MVTIAAGTAAAAERPVLAIFPIQQQEVSLSPEVLDRLGDYVSTRLAASGELNVIPREGIKQRLRTEKLKSYRECYDQSCQIEIGKELAAHKTLAIKIMRLGSRCVVTGTIFDLKLAAAEHGATARGECTEDAVVGALDTVVAALSASVKRKRKPEGPEGPEGKVGDGASARSTVGGRPLVSVTVTSSPPGASLSVDGQARGKTPTRLDLIAGGTYALVAQAPHHRPKELSISPRRDHTIHVQLQLSESGRLWNATRTEWISGELMGGFEAGERGSGFGGVMISAFTLKWLPIWWTIFEIGGGGGGNGGTLLGGTRLGYPFYFGAHGEHQLRVGATLGWYAVYGLRAGDDPAADPDARDRDYFTGMLSPTIHYYRQGKGTWAWGVGLRGVLPFSTTSAGDYPGKLLVSLVICRVRKP